VKPRASGRNELLDTAWRPGPAELAERLQSWVSARLGDVQIHDVTDPDEGGSSVNLMFAVTDDDGIRQEFVARLGSQPARRTFPDESLDRESRYMRAVRRVTDVPVPPVIHYEQDTNWLGVPFILMPRLAGRPWPSDPPYNFSGWVLGLSEAQQQTMQLAVLTTMARIHSVPATSVDLTGVLRPESGTDVLESAIGYLEYLYEWGREGVRFDIVETALSWLRQSVPARSEPARVVWGDARPGNVLFDHGEISAVLDWECAASGYPEQDIAFACMMHRYYQQRAEAAGQRGLPQLFRLAEAGEQYAMVSGRLIRDLEWFFILAAARAAAIQVRVLTRAAAVSGRRRSTATPDDALPVKPILQSALANQP
jgi:aminoglycoside phosphotransferase (APT) family kinase protein